MRPQVLEVDTRPAAATDDLHRTVNYAELAQRLHDVLAGEPVQLLETLAQRLADVCLGYEMVEAVEITVHNAQVVQIERKEKFRLQQPGNKSG